MRVSFNLHLKFTVQSKFNYSNNPRNKKYGIGEIHSYYKKRIENNQAPNFKVAKDMAYFDLFGMEKIPKNEADALANRYFLPPNALTPKSNSTDFTLTDVKNLESTLGKLKEGQTYVDPFRRQVFLYAGTNTFRPLSKY